MARKLEVPKIIVQDDNPIEGFEIDQIELEDKLNAVSGDKKREQAKREKFWEEISTLRDQAKLNPAESFAVANQIEHLMLERKDFEKWLGEEELYDWLADILGRNLRVELSKKGVTGPIKNEKE